MSFKKCSTKTGECVNTVPVLYLREMSQCEHDRDVVFFELLCQHVLFGGTERTVIEIPKGHAKGFSLDNLAQTLIVLFLT